MIPGLAIDYTRSMKVNTPFEFLVQESFQLCSAMHCSFTLLLLLSKTGCRGTPKFHPVCNKETPNRAGRKLRSSLETAIGSHHGVTPPPASPSDRQNYSAETSTKYTLARIPRLGKTKALVKPNLLLKIRCIEFRNIREWSIMSCWICHDSVNILNLWLKRKLRNSAEAYIQRSAQALDLTEAAKSCFGRWLSSPLIIIDNIQTPFGPLTPLETVALVCSIILCNLSMPK